MTTTPQAPRCPLRKGHLFVMCGGSMRCSCCGEPFLVGRDARSEDGR